MYTNLLLVAAGGAVGSVLRYLCQRWLNGPSFPLGTLLVNMAGCLVIGLLLGLFARQDHEQRRLLLVTGLCGGFTTFSSFSFEGVQLLTADRWLSFALYTALSVAVGLLATYAGYKITSA